MTSLVLATVLSVPAMGVLTDSDAPSKPDLHWSRHYDKAKHAAQTAKRPLLVVIENPSEAKQRLDEERLPVDTAQQGLLGKFHLCRVDATTDYGKRVAKAFGAQQFPFTAIIDKQSRLIVFRKAGQMTRQEWRNALARKNSPSGTRVVVKRPILTDFGTSVYGPAFSQPFGSSAATCFT